MPPPSLPPAEIIIFMIGPGDDVESNFLKRVADGGVNGMGPCQGGDTESCRYYFAPTTRELDAAFEAIAEQTHFALVR